MTESNTPGAAPQAVPAGWYNDGIDPRQRYWDGAAWTEHYAPAAEAPVAQAPVAQAQVPPVKKKRTGLIVAIVAVSVLVVGGGATAAVLTVGPLLANASLAPNWTGGSEDEEEDDEPEEEEPDAELSFYEDYGVFDEFEVTGSGDETIELDDPVIAGYVTLQFEGTDIELETLDEDGALTDDIFAFASSDYAGSTAWGLDTFDGEAFAIEVRSDGDWTITIAPLSEAPVFELDQAGSGDEVFLYDGDESTVDFEYLGDDFFFVWQENGDHGDYLAQSEGGGDYTGEVELFSGPSIVQVMGLGSYEFTEQ